MSSFDSLEKLNKRKRKGYMAYPLLLILLWFSPNNTFSIIVGTIMVIYIMIHQFYFYYKKTLLDTGDIGF